MNQMMKGQLNQYEVQSAMILGIAGGNGLEHVDTLDCLCVDLVSEAEKLPQADMLIANLLIEYIGYECFKKVVTVTKPVYVSCIIQVNVEDSFVSESPYLHAFDGLVTVHHQMVELELQNSMNEIDYHLIQVLEHQLPNGKKFVQFDFYKQTVT